MSGTLVKKLSNLSVPSLSGWCVKQHRRRRHGQWPVPFSSLFIGMVCEARACTVLRACPKPPFSSLFIGMVCEARSPVCGTMPLISFQFPLYRDGV